MLSSGSSENSEQTADEIVSRILRGETELYEEIIRRFQHDVFRIVSALLYDRSATEDVTQQVFLNVYVNLQRFELGRDFGAWIRTVARNSVREELRKRFRYDRRLKAYGEMLDARFDGDRSTDLYEETRREALADCLQELEDKSARAVQMRYVEGKAFTQIATAMETSSGAVRNLLLRVRVKLRKCVESKMQNN